MAAKESGICDVCGKVGSVHLTEWRGRKKVSRSFCVEHAPQQMRDMMPFGPHRTPAEEVAFLRQQLANLEHEESDPARRAEFQSAIEELIVEIEAGRRRLGGAH